MKLRVIAVMLITPMLIWVATRGYFIWRFNSAVKTPLVRAVEATTVDAAVSELKGVVSYLHNARLTSGHTSILYRTPPEDVGAWYGNIEGYLGELRQFLGEPGSRERVNRLLERRRTLIGTSDVKVRVPPGISVYPHNKVWGVFGAVSLILFVIGVLLYRWYL